MGSITVCCPIPTYLASAVTSLNPCVADAGQIQKLIFWRTGNSIASVATALISTTWTALLTATGDTKALVSPLIHNPDVPYGDAREYGGGNETQFGASLKKGSQAAIASFNLVAEDQDIVTALKALRCETLDVIFINEANQFIYNDAESDFRGFEIIRNSFFISDKKLGGFEEYDTNLLQFALKPNWSDTLEISAASTFALSMINT